MTSNPRRPGFRLPWSADSEATKEAEMPADSERADTVASAVPPPATATPPSEATGAAPRAGATNGRTSAEPDAGESETPTEFLRDLVSAMRGVAETARQETLEELRGRADDLVRQVQSASERRSADLRSRAESDIAGIGEWARAEAERIRQEADGRVAARQAQLEQQLGAESRRSEEEATALRARLTEYERELEAYHAQLAEINDPAAFAAAAKRIPRPPQLVPGSSAEPAETPATNGITPEETPPPVAPEAAQPEPAGTLPPTPTEEALAGRLAELDAALASTAAQVSAPSLSPSPSGMPPAYPANDQPAEADAGPQADPVPATDPAPAAPAAPGATATAVIVKGLGSFGAITGFRQSLAGVEGIEGVSLSLGPTGEFVYRATHAEGFDVAAAIRGLEGEGASVEAEPDGTLRVTVSRAR